MSLEPTLHVHVHFTTDIVVGSSEEDTLLIIDTNDFLGSQDDADITAVFSGGWRLLKVIKTSIDHDEGDPADQWSSIYKLPPLLQDKLQQLRIERFIINCL